MLMELANVVHHVSSHRRGNGCKHVQASELSRGRCISTAHRAQDGDPSVLITDVLQLVDGTGAFPFFAFFATFACKIQPQLFMAALLRLSAGGLVCADRGAAMSEERQAQVDALLEKLESIGVAQVALTGRSDSLVFQHVIPLAPVCYRPVRVTMQEPRPLDNPLIYGNFSVAYVSTRNAAQKGQRAPCGPPVCCMRCCADAACDRA